MLFIFFLFVFWCRHFFSCLAKLFVMPLDRRIQHCMGKLIVIKNRKNHWQSAVFSRLLKMEVDLRKRELLFWDFSIF